MVRSLLPASDGWSALCLAVSGVQRMTRVTPQPNARDVARLRRAALLAVSAVLMWPLALRSEPIQVRHTEGLVHGFLVMRTLDGNAIARGDLTQRASGDRVTSRMGFRFSDGSSQEETTIYSQRGVFRLLRHRLVQKGPVFERPVDMSVDGNSGLVTVRYTDDEGEEKVETERIEMPPDLANGMVSTLLKNVDPARAPKAVSYMAATPKPRVIKLQIRVAGNATFSTAGVRRTATHYLLEPEIGGVAGVVAPLVGKQPPDSHVWILGGDAPAFVRSESPLFNGGPMVRIELVSPTWPAATEEKR
jgi:hypothetical protein